MRQHQPITPGPLAARFDFGNWNPKPPRLALPTQLIAAGLLGPPDFTPTQLIAGGLPRPPEFTRQLPRPPDFTRHLPHALPPSHGAFTQFTTNDISSYLMRFCPPGFF